MSKIRAIGSSLALFPLIQCGADSSGGSQPCGLPDAERLIVNVLQYLWFAAGIVAVLVVFWSAFQFITAAGDATKAETARKTLWSAVIGIIIIVVAYAFVRVFASTIFGGPVELPSGITPTQ